MNDNEHLPIQERFPELDKLRVSKLEKYIDRLFGTIKVDPSLMSSRNKESMLSEGEKIVAFNSVPKENELKDSATKKSSSFRGILSNIINFNFKFEPQKKSFNPYEEFDNLILEIVEEKAFLEQKKMFADSSDTEKEKFVHDNLKKLEISSYSENKDEDALDLRLAYQIENITKEMLYSGLVDLSTIIQKRLLDKNYSLVERSNFIIEFLEDKIKKPIYAETNLKVQDINWTAEISKLRAKNLSFNVYKNILSKAYSVNLIFREEQERFLNINEPFFIRVKELELLLNKRLKIAEEAGNFLLARELNKALFQDDKDEI